MPFYFPTHATRLLGQWRCRYWGPVDKCLALSHRAGTVKLGVKYSPAGSRSIAVLIMCLVVQSCLALCDPVPCSPPGSSVHGVLQAKIVEWVAISFSRGSFWPRDVSPALQVDSLPLSHRGNLILGILIIQGILERYHKFQDKLTEETNGKKIPCYLLSTTQQRLDDWSQ